MTTRSMRPDRESRNLDTRHEETCAFRLWALCIGRAISSTVVNLGVQSTRYTVVRDLDRFSHSVDVLADTHVSDRIQDGVVYDDPHSDRSDRRYSMRSAAPTWLGSRSRGQLAWRSALTWLRSHTSLGSRFPSQPGLGACRSPGACSGCGKLRRSPRGWSSSRS